MPWSSVLDVQNPVFRRSQLRPGEVSLSTLVRSPEAVAAGATRGIVNRKPKRPSHTLTTCSTLHIRLTGALSTIVTLTTSFAIAVVRVCACLVAAARGTERVAEEPEFALATVVAFVAFLADAVACSGVTLAGYCSRARAVAGLATARGVVVPGSGGAPLATVARGVQGADAAP